MRLLDWDQNAYYHRLLMRQLPSPSSHETMPKVLDPPLTTRQVRQHAAAALPGARVRRLVFWRYLLIWQRPIETHTADGGPRTA